jgi:hypothetical protein
MSFVAFWGSLWPNLVATLVGVIVGLPTALWLNRRFLAHAHRLEQARERSQVASMLAVVSDTLSANLPRFKEASTAVAAGLFTYDTEIDVAAWDGVRGELPRLLNDPELLGRLSSHFSRVQAFEHLNETWATRCREKDDPSANWKSKIWLRADVVRLGDGLHSEAKILQDEVERVILHLDEPLPSRRIAGSPASYLAGRPIEALPAPYQSEADSFRQAVAEGDLTAFLPTGE